MPLKGIMYVGRVIDDQAGSPAAKKRLVEPERAIQGAPITTRVHREQRPLAKHLGPMVAALCFDQQPGKSA